MKRVYRLLLGIVILVILLCASLTLPSMTPKAQAASCYGGAFNLPGTYIGPGGYYSSPTYQTGPNCSDINFRYTEFLPIASSMIYVDIRVCFHPSSGGVSCNAWKWYNDFNWHTPATAVKDNTRYHLEFHNIYQDGGIAFKAQVAD